MGDKNFFEPYIDKKDSKSDRQKIIAIVAGGLAALLLVYVVINVVRIPMLKREIARVSSELNEGKLLDKKASVDNKREILAELEQMETEIDYVSLELNEKDKLGVYLVETITNSMPNDIFLKSVDIKEDLIILEGISRTKEDIAQLEANLRQVIYFKDVFIPEIVSDEGFFSFTTTMSLTEEGMVEQGKVEGEADKDSEDSKEKDEGESEEEPVEDEDKEDDKDET